MTSLFILALAACTLEPMPKLIPPIIFSIFFVASCSTPALREEKIIDDNFQITREKENETWVRKFVFENNQKARSYALERRLSLQRLYQLTSEPYFGTPEEIDCKDNIDTNGIFQKVKGGEVFSLRLLSNKNHALGDCLKENNHFRVYYQFYLCANQVYEYRIYKSLQDSVAPLNSDSVCE